MGGGLDRSQPQPRGTDAAGAMCFDLLSTNPNDATRTVNSANPGKVLGVVVEIRRSLRRG